MFYDNLTNIIVAKLKNGMLNNVDGVVDAIIKLQSINISPKKAKEIELKSTF